MLEILTQVEKLKRIRKQLHVTQEELAGATLTRSHIAQLENSKKTMKITDDAARCLVENIKNISYQKNIKIDVTIEYLTETLEQQINRIISEYSNNITMLELKNFNESEIKRYIYDIEEFIIKIDDMNIKKNEIKLSKQINIYKRIAEILRKNYRYSEAIQSLLKATSIATTMNRHDIAIGLILERIRIYYEINLPSQELMLSDYALDYCRMHKMNDENILKRINFNRATSFMYIGEFSKCESTLKEMHKKYIFSEEELLDVRSLIASNWFKQKEYTKAKDEWEQVLKKAIRKKNDVMISRTHRNLAEVYIELKQYEEANKYLENAKSLRDTDNYVSKMEIQLSLLKLNIKSNVKSKQIKYIFKELIQICEKNSNIRVRVQAYALIIQHYIAMDEIEELLNLLLKIRDEIVLRKIRVNTEIYSLLFKSLEYLKIKHKNEYEEAFTISIMINKYLNDIII